MPQDSLDLVVTMIQSLSNKVDGIVQNSPTRHEFENLSTRIDSFLLKSEFDLFKKFFDERFESFLEVQEEIQSLRDKLQALKDKQGKFPQWATNLIIGVLSASAGGAISSIITVMELHAKH